MKKEVVDLVKYRLKEAFESLEEAKILLKGNKPRGAMNRIYYSMFYATSSLLATKQLGASKHSGVISIFHREFVKTGIFPKGLAKSLDIAFDLRTKGDYRDFIVLDKDKVEEILKDAKSFVNKAKEVVEKIIKGKS